MSRLFFWVPPVAWMLLIAWFSTEDWSAERTGELLGFLARWVRPDVAPSEFAALHGLLRKLAHFTVYAVLAALWFVALVRGRSLTLRAAFWLSLGLSVAWAFVDEAHQGLLAARTGSLTDVAIDATGALLTLVALRVGWPRAGDALTTALLWAALAAMAGALAVGALADVTGILWLTAPAAAALLLLRRRGERRSPRRPPAGGRGTTRTLGRRAEPAPEGE